MSTSEEQTGLSPADLARRVARELQPDWVVNVGVGMPLSVVPHVPASHDIMFHSENGIIGMGPAPEREADNDTALMSAGRQFVTLREGGSYVDHADSFIVARGGRLDATILGAFQVAENGDLANWRLPTAKTGNIGGAMDLAVGAKRVYAMMSHTARDGSAKIVSKLTYPPTALGVVTKVFTELAVIAVGPDGFILEEVAPGQTAESVQALTEAKLIVSPNLKVVETS